MNPRRHCRTSILPRDYQGEAHRLRLHLRNVEDFVGQILQDPWNTERSASLAMTICQYLEEALDEIPPY